MIITISLIDFMPYVRFELKNWDELDYEDSSIRSLRIRKIIYAYED